MDGREKKWVGVLREGPKSLMFCQAAVGIPLQSLGYREPSRENQRKAKADPEK